MDIDPLHATLAAAAAILQAIVTAVTAAKRYLRIFRRSSRASR